MDQPVYLFFQKNIEFLFFCYHYASSSFLMRAKQSGVLKCFFR